MKTVASEGRRYFSSIQVLRGIAAMAVILIHVSDMLQQYTDQHGLFCRLSHIWYTGAAGVDLFFIISGFVMVQSTRYAFQKPGAGRKFLARRFIRIVPLYWLYTSLMLILVLLPSTLKSTSFSAIYTLKSFLFIPALNPTNGLNLPLLPQGWTLSYEVYFYLIYSVLLFFPRKQLPVTLSILFLLSIGSSHLIHLQDPVLEVLTNPMLLEFVLGCYLAFLLDRLNLSSRTAFLTLTSGIILLLLSSFTTLGTEHRLFTWGIPMALVATGFVFLEKNAPPHFPRFLLEMGNSSYSTYLSHVFVLLIIATLLKKDLLPPSFLPNDLIAILSIILCLSCGHISYLTLEKYLSNNFLKQFR